MARERIEVNGSGNGNLVKWKDQHGGEVFEGVFVAQRRGQYGALFDLQTEEGNTVTLAGSTVLSKRMDFIRLGAFVTVEYLGTKPNKKAGAQPFHDFRVFVSDAADQLKAPRSGDDVPF